MTEPISVSEYKHWHVTVHAYGVMRETDMTDFTAMELLVMADDLRSLPTNEVTQPPESPEPKTPNPKRGRVTRIRLAGDRKSDLEQYALQHAEVLLDKKKVHQPDGSTNPGGFRVAQIIEHDSRLGPCPMVGQAVHAPH